MMAKCFGKKCYRDGGFTFVELMVASIIGAFIAIVAVGVLKAVSSSAERVNDNIEQSTHVKYAAKLIALDLANVYRDRRAANMKMVGMIDEDSGSSVLTFYTVSRVKARYDEPECDIYEVEYRVLVSEDEDEGKSSLMRRFWPNPDAEREPGGILTAIADGVNGFFVRYYDGNKWQVEWPEGQEELPELLEVSIIEGGEAAADILVKSFFVNLVSSAGGQMETFADEEELSEDEDGQESDESGE